MPFLRLAHARDAGASVGVFLVRAAAAARRNGEGAAGIVSAHERHARADATAESVRRGTSSSAFLLTSSLGTFKVSPGGEVLVGRDPARCAIHLTEPRVSALHATMKIESGSLFVRDEGSNNGVWINGERMPAGAWSRVPPNAALRFGPIQFTVAPA